VLAAVAEHLREFDLHEPAQVTVRACVTGPRATVQISRGRHARRSLAAKVRKWRKALLEAEVGEVTVAKSYRLLKAIMNTTLG
jgi:hypothetical protein